MTWEPLHSRRPPQLLRLDGGSASCVEYRTRPAHAASPFPRLATPDAFVGGDARIFLRPSTSRRDLALEVRIEAPEGLRVSTAWPTVDGVARPDPSFLHREAHFAFGAGMATSTYEVAGAVVHRARLSGALSVTDDELDEWLRGAVAAVATIRGRFPRSLLQVVVVPVSSGEGPVPFGLVRRGGGASVLLLVSEDASLDALRRDWVVVHELTHLLFPLVERGDAWLSEGLSTYYQEVFRARAALIEPRDAWRRLVAGFERGRRDRGALPLGVESERMMERRSFHRVYWSGAAFALLVDLDLRARGTSLDALVGECAAELARATRSFTAEELLLALESSARGSVLTNWAASLESSASFPDVSSAMEELGITVDDDGEVSFSDAGPARALRAAIMGGD